MSIFFTPCPTGTDCSQETSINGLKYIFGRIVDVMSTGQLPNTGTEDGFIATMLHWFSVGMMTIIFIILSITILRGLNNARETGTWYGDSWHPVWTPARLFYSLVMAAPMKFGYGLIHILILMIALWGIGFANYIYKTAVIDKAFISPQSSAYESNDYGFRTFAAQYFKSSYCAHLFNSSYSGSANVSLALKSGLPNLTSPTFSQSYEFLDKGASQLGGQTPFCGTVTINRYDSSKATIDGSDATYQALNTAQGQTQNAKNNATTALMSQIDAWVSTLPVNDDPNAWAAVDTNQLNILAENANASVSASVKSVIEGMNTAGTFDTYKNALKDKGWASMGGWTGQVASLMSRLVDVANMQIGGATSPTWQNLPDSAQVQQIKSIYNAAVPTIVKSSDEKKVAAQNEKIALPDFELEFLHPIDSINRWFNTATVALDATVKETLSMTYQVSNFSTATSDTCGSTAYLGHSIARIGCAGANLATFGRGLYTTAITGVAVAQVAGAGSAGGFSINFGPLALTIAEPVKDAAQWLIREGNYLSIIVPLLPTLFLMLAVIGFFIQILQSMIAATLWLILHSLPEKTFLGSQTQGYLLLLSLLARPALIVIGFIAALSLSDALLPYTLSNMLSAGSKSISLTGLSGFFEYIFSLNVRLVFYCSVVTIFLYLVLGLPHSLFDQVFTWIGVNVHPLGDASANSGFLGRSTQGVGSALNTYHAKDILRSKGQKANRDQLDGEITPSSKRTTNSSITSGG